MEHEFISFITAETNCEKINYKNLPATQYITLLKIWEALSKTITFIVNP